MIGTVVSVPTRRRTPAGTPVTLFRLHVEPSPEDPAVSACTVPVVALGEAAEIMEITQSATVCVEGALTERRWKAVGGAQHSRFEILARRVSVL